MITSALKNNKLIINICEWKKYEWMLLEKLSLGFTKTKSHTQIPYLNLKAIENISKVI